MEQNMKQQVPLWTRRFILITIVHFLFFTSFQMQLPTLPLFAVARGADESSLGLLTGLFTISATLIRPVAGIFADRIGRKEVFLIGILIFTLSVASYPSIGIISVLLLVRFIHGFGWGSASTASETAATDCIPSERFGEGLGYFHLASSMAMAVGPILGSFLANRYSYGTMFYTAVGLSLLSVLLILNISFEKTERKPKMTHTKERFSFDKALIRPMLLMFFLAIPYGCIISFMAVFAGGQGVSNIGIFFTVYAITMMFTRPLWGLVIDRLGYSFSIIPGALALAASMLCIANATSLSLFLLAAVLHGIGFAACHSSLQTMALVTTAPEKRGMANATFMTGFDGGLALGAIVYGFVAAAFGYSKMFTLATIPVAIALILYVFSSTMERGRIKHDIQKTN